MEDILRKTQILKVLFFSKIYEDKWIKKETKIEKLAGTPRKLLTLYATLSKTKNIVFDLPALDWEGTEFAFKMVNDAVKDGGSAILLDGFDDMKEYAPKFIEVEWNINNLPPLKEFKF